MREVLLKIVNFLSLSLYPARYRSRFCKFSRPLPGLIQSPDRTPAINRLGHFHFVRSADDVHVYLLGKADQHEN